MPETRLTFRDKHSEKLWNGDRVPKFQEIERQAVYRLEILFAAPSRLALKNLPGNRFEALVGNRRSQFSIRINKQWRICFEWPDDASAPFNIEIVDYH